jgi:hypothetical protein
MRGVSLLAVLAATCVAASLAHAAPAHAAFGIAAFDGEVTADVGGSTFTQAAGHPYAASTTIKFNTHDDLAQRYVVPDADVRSVKVDLPPGFVGNPLATPTRCKAAELIGLEDPNQSTCPLSSQVGLAAVKVSSSPTLAKGALVPIFNMEPSPGQPGAFAFNVLGVPVRLVGKVRSDGDYGLSVHVSQISQGLPVLATTATFWGVPSDHSHDAERGYGPFPFSSFSCASLNFDFGVPCSNPTDAPRMAFLTNPSSCTAPGVGLETRLRVESWEQPSGSDEASFFSHQPAPDEDTQIGPTDCNVVPFQPTADLKVIPRETDASTGLSFDVNVPDTGILNADGIAQANVRRVVVTLPKGMTINPSQAVGLDACTPAQYAGEEVSFHPDPSKGCPPGSKIGSVEVRTPLLEEVLSGDVYVAQQDDPATTAHGSENPFDSLIALYIVVKDPERGIIVKLAGKVELDAQTGQIVSTFNDIPQLPFSQFSLKLREGSRAPLIMPSTCGTYAVLAELTPWSSNVPTRLTRSFAIDQGCDKHAQFTPQLSAGTANPAAGQFSPFSLRVTRPDGQQNVSRLDATLPLGLTAKLAGIALCGDADAATGNCPPASQVGTTTVGAGAGPSPVYVPQPGKAPTAVYLAGPYKGAPLSLVVKVPAQAGPFDLGTVTVRNALQVNPETAQVTAKSDPLPQILQGIPIAYRDVRVDVDRPDFTLNPTSCDPMEVTSTITSVTGKTANPSSRFQVANCERLAFKPKLALSLSGAPTRRGGYPKLRAELTMPKDGANIAKAQVTLPKTEFLENAHIQTICTRVQYAAKSCPAKSIYGYAKAWSPLLDQPLQGPVYLRSSSHKLPDLVASLDGQIHVDLAGRIDSVNARIRNTFDLVPDAPVSKFVLTMKGGKQGLLVNNTNLCKAKPRAEVKFDGQNGKVHDINPLVKVDCGKRRKGKK